MIPMTDAKDVDAEPVGEEKGFRLGRSVRQDQDTEHDRPPAGLDRPAAESAVDGQRPKVPTQQNKADDPVDREVVEPAADAPATRTPADGQASRTPVGSKPAPASMPTPPAAPASGRPPMELIATGDIAQYRDEWRTIQTSFVDDPAGSVRDADALLGRLFDTITSRITQQRSALSAHRSDDAEEHTEQLRLALRDYRTIFEQLLPGPRA